MLTPEASHLAPLVAEAAFLCRVVAAVEVEVVVEVHLTPVERLRPLVEPFTIFMELHQKLQPVRVDRRRTNSFLRKIAHSPQEEVGTNQEVAV